MKHTKTVSGIGAAMGMLVLILDSKTAISGAQEGIVLCLRTVIPSLFPFFIFSIALTGSFSGIHIPVLRLLGKMCKLPQGSEAILLTGFLGGYPVGAQAVYGAYRYGQLSKSQANRMLAFCNQAGPSFIFGMIASQFPTMLYPGLLWGIHLLSAILVSVVLPAGDLTPVKLPGDKPMSLSHVMKKALYVMASVCGWVVLFRVILSFLYRWVLWAIPVPMQVLVTGLLELTNGCCSLSSIENVGLRFILCAGMLTFGGLCVTMQTLSVTEGLGNRNYITGKLMQTVFCVLLAVGCQGLFPRQIRSPIPDSIPGAAIALLSIILVFTVKKQKNSSNPYPIGV